MVPGDGEPLLLLPLRAVTSRWNWAWNVSSAIAGSCIPDQWHCACLCVHGGFRGMKRRHVHELVEVFKGPRLKRENDWQLFSVAGDGAANPARLTLGCWGGAITETGSEIFETVCRGWLQGVSIVTRGDDKIVASKIYFCLIGAE